MVNRKLNSIKFPDIADTYILDADKVNYDDSETYASGSVGKALQNKANIDGSYEDLTAGTANQINTSVRANDKTPYLFRTSGGSVDIGDREYINGIVGGTVAWNQLAPNNYSRDTSGAVAFNSGTSIVAGHKYLITRKLSANVAIGNSVYFYTNGATAQDIRIQGTDTAVIQQASHSGTSDGTTSWNEGNMWIYQNSTSDPVTVTDLNIIDLTQMFGSTIADYIYSLETATAGAGVAWFKKLFDKPYYAYNAGELKSVSGLVSHDMVGFNAWDEEWEVGTIDPSSGQNATSTTYSRTKNYIKVLPNTNYYLKNVPTPLYLRKYGANKEYLGYVQQNGNSIWTIPADTYYIRFVWSGTSYNNDICINLSWDGSRNGEYEPYVKHSYPLDSDITLRGLFKLDANNNLYADGDIYPPSGEVTRKMKSVTLTGQESVITSGVQGGFFSAHIYADAKSVASNNDIGNVISDKLVAVSANTNGTGTVSNIAINAGGRVIVNVYGATSLAEWRTAVANMNATIVYELATPTTETADAYVSPQIVDDFGTEEYVISNSVFAVPVGHDTDYPINMVAKLEMAPNSPDGDGDYIVRQTNGTNEYVALSGNATIQNIISRLEALENA